MTPETNNNDDRRNSQAEFQSLVSAKLLDAVRITILAIMEAELEAFVGAPWGVPSLERKGYRNGYSPRDLVTSVGLLEKLKVPRARKPFRSQVFEQYQRRQRVLDEMIGEMFVKGVSTAGVGQIMKTLTRKKVSKSTVSRVHHGLDAEYQTWKRRDLAERYAYVFADGTYFSVIYNDEAQKTPVLALIGIAEDGRREVIAFTIGERENRGAWDNLLDDIKTRGVKQVGLWITDGHQAMLAAIAQKFPLPKRQRCTIHKTANILSHVPQAQQDEVEHELKGIFYQDNRVAADQCAAAFRTKYQSLYPTAIECMDRDWEACLTFYEFPSQHWKRIRTTNVIERTFEEVKKRTKKMSAAFRNEHSCLLMFYAIVRALKFQNVVMPSRNV